LPTAPWCATGVQPPRRERDGSTAVHADLTRISKHIWSEMTIDGRGNIYVNSIGFDFDAEMSERVTEPSRSPTGVIALITPDGIARKVADGIAFPNGMVVTPDNETLIVAESFTGKLLAFDVADDGAVARRRLWGGA